MGNVNDFMYQGNALKLRFVKKQKEKESSAYYSNLKEYLNIFCFNYR